MKSVSKNLILFLSAFILLSFTAYAQRSFMTYYEKSLFQQASPDAFKYGLYGFDNPAVLSYLNDPDIAFFASGLEKDGFRQWGLALAAPHSSLGIWRYGDKYGAITDYRYSLAFGSRIFSLGFGYGFTEGDKSYFNRSNITFWGFLLRPNPYISLGFHQTFALERNEYESVADLAIRPIKNYPLAFFGDFAMFNDHSIKHANWSAGISYEFAKGVRINTRYFDTKALSLGVDISLGHIGFATQAKFNTKQEYDYNTYMVRLGALDRTFLDDVLPMKYYLKINLGGSVKYQKNFFFDNSKTLFDILTKIDKAANDKTIKGIVVNTGNMNINREILWEIREKLKDFKATGKEVIIFAERLDIDDYHFASVADKIYIDPLGSVQVSGYMLQRSFYKDMLEKLGIGFDELRFFKYKSAYENFGREKMTDADREQRQKLVDDWYDITKNDVCNSRKFSNEEYDNIVNAQIIYDAQTAISKKLVDQEGRWVNCEDILKTQNNDKDLLFVDYNLYRIYNEPFDDKWGDQRKKIAIIYIIGDCAMDAGFNARRIVKEVKDAVEDKSIDAIVLRIDSPGGDAMASDYIAEVVRNNKGKKPIIVSQGSVAASGGYWLSMDADQIVAAPGSITGSIGVISAWLYDKGVQKSLGISSDFVKKGKYADLGQSFALPIIGIGLPVAPLTTEQRAQFETNIKNHYDQFVQKVAAGRKMSKEEVDKIAQGRVWSGLDGKKNGLVDELGGLDKAIQIAKEKAGIKSDDEIKYVQLPTPPLFDLSGLFAGMFGFKLAQITNDPFVQTMKLRIESKGNPMPALPLDYYDYIYREE